MAEAAAFSVSHADAAPLTSAARVLRSWRLLGEISVVLAGVIPSADPESLVEEVNRLVGAGMRVKDACAQVVEATAGAPSKRELYDAVLRSRG